jgi:hypothetical protein
MHLPTYRNRIRYAIHFFVFALEAVVGLVVQVPSRVQRRRGRVGEYLGQCLDGVREVGNGRGSALVC